ncbi:MAG: 50S ribosomal protein L11 methyltransferase [Erythrobacter sp.]
MKSMFDDPQELFAFCSVLRDNGNGGQAIALAKQALSEQPHIPEMMAVARMFLSHKVHSYHRLMLADQPRNDAYLAMINRHAKGRRILDIGTGTGLLAMMAVRAGAKHVYACEVNANKADLARDIVAHNGMSDAITVLNAYSLDLDKDRDLDGGVDCVLSELYTANIIGESLLQSMAHAQRELTLPGAIFLPPKVSVMGALADCNLSDPIGDVAGFDLSLLERQLNYHALIDPIDAIRYQRGPSATLCDIETLPDTPIVMRDRTVTSLTSQGGRVSGVLYWMKIELDTDIHYENCPGADKRHHWSVRFEPFAEPRDTRPGDIVRVGCAHNSNEILIWDDSAA